MVAVRGRERDQTRTVVDAALRDLIPPTDLDIEWPVAENIPPVWKALQHRRHRYRASVRYGSDPAQVLDVWRRKDLPVEPAPVLVFVPGGAWVHGGRALQGYALLSHLAERGWVCLSIGYRVAPHHRWPRHINDVNAAVAWARANVDRFGGDRGFVVQPQHLRQPGAAGQARRPVHSSAGDATAAAPARSGADTVTP